MAPLRERSSQWASTKQAKSESDWTKLGALRALPIVKRHRRGTSRRSGAPHFPGCEQSTPVKHTKWRVLSRHPAFPPALHLRLMLASTSPQPTQPQRPRGQSSVSGYHFGQKMPALRGFLVSHAHRQENAPRPPADFLSAIANEVLVHSQTSYLLAIRAPSRPVLNAGALFGRALPRNSCATHAPRSSAPIVYSARTQKGRRAVLLDGSAAPWMFTLAGPPGGPGGITQQARAPMARRPSGGPVTHPSKLAIRQPEGAPQKRRAPYALSQQRLKRA